MASPTGTAPFRFYRDSARVHFVANARMTLAGGRLAGRMIALTILTVASLACALEVGTGGVTFTTAAVSDAWLTTDPQGEDPATEFSPGDRTIYLFVDLADSPSPTKVKVKWVAYDAGGKGLHIYFLTSEAPVTTGVFYFYVTREDLWPPGRYGAHVFLNDQFQKAVDFEVK